MTLATLLLWSALAIAFVLGLTVGSWLQSRHDQKVFKAANDELARAALRRVLKFPTAHDLAEREKHPHRPDINIVKGFDDDD